MVRSTPSFTVYRKTLLPFSLTIETSPWVEVVEPKFAAIELVVYRS